MSEASSGARPPLDGLFEAQSIAVFGVSAKPANLAARIVRNLDELGYRGTVYPIGQSADEIRGRPVLRSVLDAPGPVELAAVVVPALAVPQVLEDCGQKGVRWVSITSSGFGEFTDERRALDDEILAIARRYGMRLLGPNGQGIIDFASGLCTAFGRGAEDATAREGQAALVVQSGTMKSILHRLLTWENIGITRVASIGNKLDVDEVDLLPLLLAHAPTRLICLYLESIRRGRALVDVARTADKPIVLLKGNRTEAAARIARTHSASILNDSRVVQAAARQGGLVLVEDFPELPVVAKALLLPPMRGNRLAIMSGSGALGVLAADWAQRGGFALPPLPRATAAHIEQYQPLVKVGNPIDLGDFFNAGQILTFVDEVLGLPDYDGLVLCMFDPSVAFHNLPERPFHVEVEALCAKHGKPVALVFSADRPFFERLKQQSSFPTFMFPSEAVKGLAAQRDYWRARQQAAERPPARTPGRAPAVEQRLAAVPAGRGALGYADAFAVLAAVGLPVEAPRLATSADEAVTAASVAGGPVALKLVAGDGAHKSEANAVRLNLAGDAAVRLAATELLAAQPGGPLAVQPMVRGVEIMLGGRRDPQFGPVVSVGLGGVQVELLDDVALRLAPLTRAEASEMLGETRAARLLAGFRNQPPADADAVIDAIARLSWLLADYPEIMEVDVNPLVVLPPGDGARAVDARVLVERGAP
ncbi:MAG TPA: acetate--CoA ligase family protein [Chloroflexota bacterium]|jgi:acetyltransferase